MLTYEDVESVLPITKGIKGAPISFEGIVFTSAAAQPKGLFIQSHSEDLQAAISNGAVAAVWPAHKELPDYRPNHFPVFLTEDEPMAAAVRIVEQFGHKLSLEKMEGKTMIQLPESTDSMLIGKIKDLLRSTGKGDEGNREGAR